MVLAYCLKGSIVSFMRTSALLKGQYSSCILVHYSEGSIIHAYLHTAERVI